MVTLDGEDLVGLVAVMTLPLAALAAIFVGGTAAAAVGVVGWLLLVPVLAILFEDEELRFGESSDEPASASTARQDPLDTLRDRYARGELSDEEFEARLERILEPRTSSFPGGRATGSESERASSSAEPRGRSWRSRGSYFTPNREE